MMDSVNRSREFNLNNKENIIEWKKMNRFPRTCETITKDSILISSEPQKEREKRVGQKQYLNK